MACTAWNSPRFFMEASSDDVGRCLLEGAEPNARDGYGWTPLHFAVRDSKTSEVVQVLLDAGTDPSARDGYGRTASDLIEESSHLKGIDVYWQLNDARY